MCPEIYGTGRERVKTGGRLWKVNCQDYRKFGRCDREVLLG